MKKARTLIISCLAVLLCVSLIAGGTYALFSDEVSVSNHIEAGDLNITLTRTQLTSYFLDNEGLFTSQNNTTPVNVEDLSNLFDIADGTKLVPGSRYIADFKIENIKVNNLNGEHSDVAYRYWIEIVCDSTVSDMILAGQLQVIVNRQSDPKTAMLNSGLYVGSETAPIATVKLGGSDTFTVDFQFLNLDNEVNNQAKNQTVDFDFIVHAVQVTNDLIEP